jgi:hypothetical protein
MSDRDELRPLESLLSAGFPVPPRHVFLQMTPEQRLAWLEEAIAFAAREGILPRPEGED